jgi:GAF domain-containing protein
MERDLDEVRRLLDRATGALASLSEDARLRERERAELIQRLAASEQQVGRLMSLYVAAYRLHLTLDPAEVVETISDIATNLLGCEQFALLLLDPDGEPKVAAARGLDADGDELPIADDPAVGATLADGQLRFGRDENGGPIAVVPLAVQGMVVGALVLIRLFAHRPALEPEDRELLDLLAAHAASALFAARAYATTDRRLRTLESLVKLVRG